MSAEFFLDTNTIVYSFDDMDASKQRVSQQLIQHALETRNGIISFQVVQEFLNVATRKLSTQLTYQQSPTYLREVLAPMCTVYPSMALYEKALELQSRWKFSFFDSLIIAAALSAGCTTLYSEDLQHEERIETLTIVNPFTRATAVHEQLAAYEVVLASN